MMVLNYINYIILIIGLSDYYACWREEELVKYLLSVYVSECCINCFVF